MSNHQILMLNTYWGEEEPFALHFSRKLNWKSDRPVCPTCSEGLLRGVGRKVRLFEIDEAWVIPCECPECGDLIAVAGFTGLYPKKEE